MEGDPGPEQIRARKFELARRGYDRAEVDRFKEEVALTVAAAHTELAQLRERLAQAGMTDLPDMKAELDAVSEEVAEVLHTARRAAESMRSRASEDAARWRADADKEVRELRVSAKNDAEEARRSAWETGTEALRAADDEVTGIIEQARQDALFIRAEAEREALRLSADARRDGEEIVRSARSQAERLLIDARAESDRILDAARQSAENAQERARALEQRRAELMKELEAARTSIGQLEQEIDHRREALQAAADAPDSGVRFVRTGDEAPREWFDEDATVRIVSTSHIPADEPVDPDAFVAEVEELKTAPPPPPPPVRDAGEETPAVEEEAKAPAPGGEAAVAETDVAEEVEADAGPAVPLEGEDEVDAGDEERDAPVEAPVIAELDPEPAPAPAPDGLDDLFAQLRTASETVTPAPPEPQPAAPEPSAADSAGESPGVQVAVLEQPGDSADSAEEGASAADLEADPFDLRDRVLLPIENRTLRGVKRRIVDLQNRVLEELRVGGDDWEPDTSMFMAAVSDEISRLNSESFVAGHAAAAELLGAVASSPPDRPASQDTVGDFVDGLASAVADAVRRSRASGGAARQVAAAVGRVFRAWRTDEAERRLRHTALAAFNGGLLGAYPGLGVERVVALAPGTACGECPAGSGKAWAPGAPPPAGTRIPPAKADCRAVVVPAR